MENRLLADAFAVLKRTLKARGMTYADVAAALDLSEVSVKRMFSQRDCKVSRLFELCELLELPPEDVLQSARRVQTAPAFLPIETEAALAADPSLFHFYILLREDFSARDISQIYGLNPLDVQDYGARLEKLGLVEVLPQGFMRLIARDPMKFRRHGPLHSLVRQINQTFVLDTIDRANDDDLAYTTLGRRMLPATVRQIIKEAQEYQIHIANLARQDRMMAADKDLVSFKWTVAMGQLHYPDLLEIKSIKRAAVLVS
ncbi:helix-turn-helix domain-containing protein [Cognatishimia sp. SS12]|uniref:helix-turn-helix domain-containing protein n=1 Tax=Cognatishimia sp. SS12 TaxID=2979465 RepID=UPI00232C92F5|nr:helix-turn-helix domain-containing protein [Cognatishimia sp. SS12]MDC0738179.1 helix-turn-helix domain-containing protein [Cognatishimia sp. SS12]